MNEQMKTEEDLLDVTDLVTFEEETPTVEIPAPARESFKDRLQREKEVLLIPDCITGATKYIEEASIHDLNALAKSLYPIVPAEVLLKEDIAITTKQKATWLDNIIKARIALSKSVIQTDPKKDIHGK